MDLKKCVLYLESVKATLDDVVGPVLEGDEQIEECGPDCDCEPCKDKYGAKDDEDEQKEQMEAKEKWIQKMHMKKGALRKKLGYSPEGTKNISAKKLNKASHSKNPTTRKQASLAKTLKGFKK